MNELLPVQLFQDRLQQVVKSFGGPEKLAKATGSSARGISKYLKGDSAPGMEILAAIATAADISLDWLVFGDRPKSPLINSDGQSEFEMIPMARAKLNAGGGNVVLSEGFKEYFAFRKEWINRISTSKSNVFLMTVEGDSMEPTIHDGDTVMVDQGRKDIHMGKVYALGFGDMIMIKRLEVLPDAKIKVISDNARYSPYIIEGESLRVIGQVVWFARELVIKE